MGKLIEFPKDRMAGVPPKPRGSGTCGRFHRQTVANTTLGPRGRRVCLACNPDLGTEAQRLRREDERRELFAAFVADRRRRREG